MPQRPKPLPRVIRYTLCVYRSCCRLHVASCPSAFDSFKSFHRFARPGRSLGWRHRQGGLPPGLTPPHPSSRAEGRWVSKTRRIWNIYLLPTAPVTLGTLTPLRSRAGPCSPLSVAAVSRRFPCPPLNRGCPFGATQGPEPAEGEAAPTANGPRGPLPAASCPLLAAFP
jgi:hypothetical protein